MKRKSLSSFEDIAVNHLKSVASQITTENVLQLLPLLIQIAQLILQFLNKGIANVHTDEGLSGSPIPHEPKDHP